MDVSSVAGTRIVEPAKADSLSPANPPQRKTGSSIEAAQTAQQPVRVSAELLEQLAQRARSVLKPVNLDIMFDVDKDSGNTIIRIMDMETETVIRQIPSEEMVALSKALEKMQGALLQNKV